MNTLQVSAESPWLVHAAAATILYLHIAGGTVALISGPIALALRKGGPRHVLAGRVFFVSMLVMASIGALVAPFLVDAQGNPKFSDSIGGFFACYLVTTSWMTVRRKAGTIGRAEVIAFVLASILAVATLLIGTSILLGARSGSATGYYVVGCLIALAAALDLKVILNGGISGTPRIARHLWRMCTALFIAVISFFLGQQRFMPEFMQGSPLLFIPPLATLAIMFFWLLKLRFAKVFNKLRQRSRLRRHEAAEGPVRAAS